jgi:hypothetical protein
MLERAEDELFRYDHHEELEAERKRRQYAELGVYGITEVQARAQEQMRKDAQKSRRQRMQPVEKLGGFWKNLGDEIAIEQGPAVLEDLNERVAKERAARGYIEQQMMDQEQ